MVAGAGTTFVVSFPADSAIFIAGQNIFFRPGTQITGGAYMHGYIDTVFCQQADAPLAMLTKIAEDFPAADPRVHFILYPNPATGNFTLVQQSGKPFSTIRVEIFSMDGGRKITETVAGGKKHEFSVERYPSGIYLVKIVAGDDVETHKLVKQ